MLSTRSATSHLRSMLEPGAGLTVDEAAALHLYTTNHLYKAAAAYSCRDIPCCQLQSHLSSQRSADCRMSRFPSIHQLSDSAGGAKCSTEPRLHSIHSQVASHGSYPWSAQGAILSERRPNSISSISGPLGGEVSAAVSLSKMLNGVCSVMQQRSSCKQQAVHRSDGEAAEVHATALQGSALEIVMFNLGCLSLIVFLF